MVRSWIQYHQFHTQGYPVKWNLSSKVKLIFGVILFLFIFGGGAAYLNVKKLESNTEWVEHCHQIIHFVQKTYVVLKDAQTNYADLLATKNKNFANACQADLDGITLEMKRADDLIEDGTPLQKDMDTLALLIQKKIGSIQMGLAYTQADRIDLAIGMIEKEKEKKSNQQIRDLVNHMTGMQIWLLKTRKILDLSNNTKNTRFMVYSTAAALIFCAIAAFFINRQINQRQAAITLLRSSEERFRFLAESANDSFITSDKTGKIVDLNHATEDLFGYPKAELLGESLVSLMPQQFTEEHGDHAFEKYVAITTTDGVKALELFGKKRDGTEFPLEVSVSKWQTKDGIFYTTISRDITERKFFIKTLLNNEHRLFQFLDAVPAGILVRDQSGMPYYANHTAKSILGLNILQNRVLAQEMPEHYHIYTAGTDQLYPPEKWPMTRALAGEKCFVDDMEMRRADKTIPLEAWGASILDENGSVKYALMAIVDVTHQRITTESLKEREEFFRNLFEEGPIGMTLAFPDGTLVNVNRAFATMLGYPKDELIGRSFFDFTHPEDVPMEQSLNSKLFDKTLPKYQVEKRYMTKAKQPVWCNVSASVIRDLNNDPLFRLAVVENITEQVESKLALKQSEEKFRALTESANEAIVSVDNQGKIIYSNIAATHLFGYRDRELKGSLLTNLFAEGKNPEHIEEFQKAFDGETSKLSGHNTEWTGVTKDDRQFPLELSLYTWFTDQGTFATAIMRNITERKQIDEMKRDLIAVVSHQLKTPVAEINGYIENMLEGLAGELTEKQVEYLSDMKEIGAENYRLISDLLSMSKIDRGVVTVDPQPVELQKIVELTIRDYETAILKKGLELKLETIDPEITVEADQDKTVETIRNILNNAIKCTDRGSITIRSRSEDGFGVVEVIDTGIGMSAEVLKKLFSKERVMGVEAGRAGAGLGLYIAKSFMSLQKGDITVSSEVGKGSTFRIKIPKTKGNTHV
jgi:PAS domain S-box-containing protein